MAVKTFALPDLGEGLVEAEIIDWHVSEGDRIVADQPLVSVETDKAVVEVPSPWSGIITALRARSGDIVLIGDALADIDDGARADGGAIVGTLHQEEPKIADDPHRVPDSASIATGARAVPAVRLRARELGVDLATVIGTGPGGAITRTDVDKAAGTSGDDGLTTARRSMARTMARAHARVVPATVTDVADITVWHKSDADITLRLVRAICAAVSVEPNLNRWYRPETPSSEQPEGVALGLAVDTPRGLYVPVVNRVDAMSPAQLRVELSEATARVRQRISGDDTVPPTFTLSNFGAIGGRHAALVVVPPQVAILGAGRAYQTVGWHNGRAIPGVDLPLSLTFDHRAVTGGEAARFLAAVVADLELADLELGER